MRLSTKMLMRAFVAMALVGTLYLIWFEVARAREASRLAHSSPAEVAAKVLQNAARPNVWKSKGPRSTLIGPSRRVANLKESVPWENRTRLTVPRFWVPTEIAHIEHGDPRVTMCKLDFDSYWRNPTRMPMFRDLVSASRCGRGKSGSLNSLVAGLARRDIRPIEPTGFVFHESRVGSTLVANMLGSIPTNLVYSESGPPPVVINHCRSCDPDQRTDLLRKVVALMGASTFHERLYFKFQSITVPNIAVLSTAFPETPWIFIYREPVQVMMSHFKKGGYASRAPCLREHRRPRKETADILGHDVLAAAAVSAERYCAAHLAMLCSSALANDEAAGNKALMINYESLPGALVHYVLPKHFGVEIDQYDMDRMLNISTVYSKRRRGLLPSDPTLPSNTGWQADSETKEKSASPTIRAAAEELMRPYFDKLLEATISKTGGDDLTHFKRLGVPTDAPPV